jgi:hypothetical protein
MGNWWFDDLGVNNLKGVPDDPDNPIILPDQIIVEFLIQNPQARADFKTLVPTMLPLEQVRLNDLSARNPRVLQKTIVNDDQIIDDAFQASQNKPGFFDPNRRRR